MIIGGIMLWGINQAYIPLGILLVVLGTVVVDIFTTLNLEFLDYPIHFVLSCGVGIITVVCLLIYAIVDFPAFVSTFFPAV